MTHKFDPKSKNKLDNEKRREILPPYEILQKLGLAPGMAVADIGCGIGYFSIPAAEITGSSSLVYAMDISEEMLEEVSRRAVAAGLTNLRNIQVEEYDLKLEDGGVDFAILSFVLHEVEDKEKYIAEIGRILKRGGKLAILEWEKKETESGPPASHRVSFEEAEKLLAESGFIQISKIDINSAHYGITAEKKK